MYDDLICCVPQSEYIRKKFGSIRVNLIVDITGYLNFKCLGMDDDKLSFNSHNFSVSQFSNLKSHSGIRKSFENEGNLMFFMTFLDFSFI